MNTQIVAVLIAEASKVMGQWFRNRPIRIETIGDAQPTTVAIESPENFSEKASGIATGCVVCAIGHLGTCSGLLNEAMRFAREEGAQSKEVVDRVGMCLDELNTMERVDLRPEMTVNLSEWEKELVNEVLTASRATRHSLEALDSVKTLEAVAATTQSVRTHIWREWIKNRTEHLTPEDQANIQKRVITKMAELLESEEDQGAVRK